MWTPPAEGPLHIHPDDPDPNRGSIGLLGSFLSLLLCLVSTADARDRIRVGDHLFLSALVADCGDRRRMIAYSEVRDSGRAEFLGLKVAAASRTGVEVASDLATAVGEQTGRTPESFEIEVVYPSDEELYFLLHHALQRDRAWDCLRKQMREEKEYQESWKQELLESLA